ncbi:MAG: neutral zinc metallopeptidase [Pseudomonadota bacterium]
MRWRGRRTSANIEDRRGGRGAVRTGGGFGVGMLLLIAASIFFPDAVPFLKMFGLGQPGAGTGTIASGPGKDDEVKEFISVTLADTEEIWNDAFRGRYREPTLVLFDGATRSPCGTASAQSGPFYCPADEKIYIDPAFFRVKACPCCPPVSLPVHAAMSSRLWWLQRL